MERTNTLTGLDANEMFNFRGGVLKNTLKHWSVTQPLITLSPAEVKAKRNHENKLLVGLTCEPHNLELCGETARVRE